MQITVIQGKKNVKWHEREILSKLRGRRDDFHWSCLLPRTLPSRAESPLLCASPKMLLWLPKKEKKDYTSVLALGHTLELSGVLLKISGCTADQLCQNREWWWGRAEIKASAFKKNSPDDSNVKPKLRTDKLLLYLKSMLNSIWCHKNIKYMPVYGGTSLFNNILFLYEVIFPCAFFSKHLKINRLVIRTHSYLYPINCPLWEN